MLIMGVGRGGQRGSCPSLDFKNFSKKVVFLISSGKKKYTTFPPWKNFGKIP